MTAEAIIALITTLLQLAANLYSKLSSPPKSLEEYLIDAKQRQKAGLDLLDDIAAQTAKENAMFPKG